MENYSIFYNSAMLNYLGQILKLADDYTEKLVNKEQEHRYVYDISSLDNLIYHTQNDDTIYYVCLMVEAIFKFVTTEMGDYVYKYEMMCDKGEIQKTCIDALKTFLDKFEKERK